RNCRRPAGRWQYIPGHQLPARSGGPQPAGHESRPDLPRRTRPLTPTAARNPMSKPDNPYINSQPGEEMGDLNASKGWKPPVAATTRDRGDGPFKRLVLRGATII